MKRRNFVSIHYFKVEASMLLSFDKLSHIYRYLSYWITLIEVQYVILHTL